MFCFSKSTFDNSVLIICNFSSWITYCIDYGCNYDILYYSSSINSIIFCYGTLLISSCIYGVRNLSIKYLLLSILTNFNSDFISIFYDPHAYNTYKYKWLWIIGKWSNKFSLIILNAFVKMLSESINIPK